MTVNGSLENQLLIGSAKGVFLDESVPMKRCKTVFEGITLACGQDCGAIWVVNSILPHPRSQALEALVSACPGTPIILLIEMKDEPAVRSVIQSNRWAYGIRYYICPLRLTDLAGEKHQGIVSPDDLQERICQLELLVMQDDLTGLKNRRYLRSFLPAILEHAETNQSQVTLLLFDIDNFKHYNDTYGHSVGDSVLCQTAELMRRCCRSQDVVVRIGGDEFAVIFWDTSSKDSGGNREDRRKAHQDHPREAVFMSERFCREMSEKVFDLLGEKGKGRLTISGGLATFPSDARSSDLLFEKADQAMLEAKRSGKNRITLVGEPV